MARATRITKEEIRERAATAREHLMVAEMALPDAEHPEPSPAAQVAASNAISAGIAAADAICGHANGVRSASVDHRDATAHLATVQPDGPALSKKLGRLLKDKTLLQYGRFCTRAKAVEMVGYAQDLVTALDSRIPPRS